MALTKQEIDDIITTVKNLVVSGAETQKVTAGGWPIEYVKMVSSDGSTWFSAIIWTNAADSRSLNQAMAASPPEGWRLCRSTGTRKEAEDVFRFRFMNCPRSVHGREFVRK